jgi:DNA-binding CsgD family transcriptional regulator
MVASIMDRMAIRVSSPIFIGRTEELLRLNANLQLAVRGRSNTTLIAGEAGVGKTRLVSELTSLARATGSLVLIGGCIVLGDGPLPFAPVTEAIRGLIRQTDPDELASVIGPSGTELARLVPDLGPSAEEGQAQAPVSAMSAQGRLFELLLGALGRLAAKSPVVFIVEDLHWSDQSTRDLLAFLVRNLHDAPVMLVFTYRSDEVHRRHPLLPFLAEVGRADRVERLELAPLDRRESADQLRAIAGHDLDDALIDSIHLRSGGNAFFAEELLAASGEDGRGELPPTLRDVLLARLVDLDEPTHEFLRVASAAGQRVDPALLAAVTGMDEAALYEALRVCVERQILVPDPTAGTERYAFRHALLQEAVYDDLLPGERTRLHSNFARTLETRGPNSAEQASALAYHWFAAHDLPRAFDWAVAAAVADADRYAFPEALAQYERALDLWAQVPDAANRIGRDRMEVLAAAAGVAAYHEPARAVSYIQQAIRLADEAGEPIRAGLLSERLGRFAWIAGHGALSQQAYRAATDLIPAAPPTEARARAMAGLAQILMLGGHFEPAGVMADEALALARELGARAIEGHALNTRGTSRAVFGEVEPAMDDLRAALAIAEEGEVIDDIGRAYANTVWILDVAGRLEEAVVVADEGVRVSERLGLMRFFGAHLLCNAGDYLFRLGRWVESELAARRAMETAPLGINDILTRELLGRHAVARGRFAEAAELLTSLAGFAERTADIQFVAPVQASLAELDLWQGNPDGAIERVTAAFRLVSHTPEIKIGEVYALGLRAYADAAELARSRRSREAAERAEAAGDALLAEIRARHAGVLVDRPSFATQSEAWLRLCEAEATRLHRRADAGAWVASAEAWEHLGRPYPAAYARWREAEARLAARGDRGEAAAALRIALATAEALGALPLAAEITALAARARLDLDSDVAVQDGTEASEAEKLGLTPREVGVLELLTLGRTNRQIAEALFISQNTAGVHVSNILGKLGVVGRGEAAALAYRLGLVEPARESSG